MPGTYVVSLEVIHPHNLSSKICTLNINKTITIIDNTAIPEYVKKEDEQYLWQNEPNPFENSTTIPYYVPFGSRGYLQIHDINGKLADEYLLKEGKNKLTINLDYLKSSIYIYSIIIGGEKKQSKKMIME